MQDFLDTLREKLGRARFEDLISTTGILIVLGIVLLLNVLFQLIPIRFDLTDHQIYTLSKGTREIVRSLDSPVKIKYYATDSRDAMSAEERQFSKMVEDRLIEYDKLGGRNIIFEKLNPEPDTNAEDSAILDGLQPLSGEEGEIYMGIVVEFIDKKEVIPYIDPRREELLEYDITNAITRVYRDERPQLKIMSSISFGGGFAGGNFQAPPTPPWFFFGQLESDFDVEVIPVDATSIDPEETDLLLVLHPYDISDTGEYAIDQYLLRGGSVLVVVDPLFYAARALSQQGNPMMGQPPSGPAPSSDLPTLFEKWGVTYESGQVLADSDYQTEIERGRFLPTLLSLTADALNAENVVTSQLTDVYLPFAGAFQLEAPEGIEVESLIHSSTNSQMVASFQAEPEAIDELIAEFRPSGESRLIAVRLHGKFESAYPDGDPNAVPEPVPAGPAVPVPASPEAPEAPADAGEAPESPADGGEAEVPEAPKSETGGEGAAVAEGAEGDAEEAAEKTAGHLTTGAEAGTVVLMSDLDFIFDQFAVRVMNFGGMRAAQPLNQNLSLFQNLVENMAGDERLITVRSRASTRRPFTLLNRMQARAQAQMMSRIEALEQKEREFEEKLSQALRVREGDNGQEIILDPEAIDQSAIEELQRSRVEASRDLREARKELKRRQEAFINFVKFLNIAVMPLVVIIVGLLLYGKRQSRIAAR